MTVYKSKRSPFWWFDFQVDGRRFFRSTKTTNKKDAQAIERAEREKARALATVAALGRPHRSALTLDDIISGGRAAADHDGIEKQIALKAARFVETGKEPAAYMYRYFDPRGDLLYVGVTLSPLRRTAEHADRAAWRRTVILKILIEPFATRAEALAAETCAIRDEFPRFNKVHNERRHPADELRRIAEEEGAP
jgi:predicted GIY-YIG superfamily endonuclease